MTHTPVSTDVKNINVAMVITGQEGITGGVEGHVEETHRFSLLSSSDHRHQHAEKDKQRRDET